MGRYAQRSLMPEADGARKLYQRGSNVVIPDTEIAAVFKASEDSPHS